MDRLPLGRTGIEVSRLCFGTMSFGGDADEETSAELYRAAREAGINFFDTADVYNDGRSEEILGRLAASERDELLIATKVNFPTGPDGNQRGLSRRHLRRSVEASLKRLGTDRIDVYYAHAFDERTPIDEVVRGLDELVRSGKVVYLGVSNWAAWQVATALGVSAREALSRFEVVQPMYNLVKRQCEVEVLPLCEHEQLAAVPYSPLGGGLLTGKYGPDRQPDSGRLVDNDMYAARYGAPSDREIAARFAEHANRRGVHPATLAVAWAMSHPAITAPIVGARNLEQLRPSLEAASLELSGDELAAIAALSPEPPPATDRIEERSGLQYGQRR